MHSHRSKRLGLALLFASMLAAGLPAEEGPQSYDAGLEALVASLVRPLINLQSQSSKEHIALAVEPIREMASGQVSKLSARIQNDLAGKIRSGTVFRVPKNPAAGSADGAIAGSYLIQGGSMLIKLKLSRGADGVEVWEDSQSFPLPSLDPQDTLLVPGSQPEGFVPPALPTPEASPTPGPASPPVPTPLPENSAAGQEAYESSYASNRVIVGGGIKGFYAMNPTFQRLVGDLKGPYLRLSWSDVVSFELDHWAKAGIGLSDLRSLSAWGTSITLSAPLRLGTHVVLMSGFGGRFESITVGDTRLPSGDDVAYGNNSFFLMAGLKLHQRRWAAETGLSYDLAANDSPYLTLKLGITYEFRLE